MNKKISFPIAFAIIIVLSVLLVGGIYLYQNYGYGILYPTKPIIWEPGEKPVACTQEAKVCPDGSAVGRTGPNCEFASCPNSKVDKTACNICKDSDSGKNYYILGSVNPCSSVDGSQCPPCGAWIDTCLDSNILLEYSCDNLNGEQYYCHNGCRDGRCNE